MEKVLLDIINKILELNDKPTMDNISPDMNLMDDIGLDSLDLAHLTVIIEKKYGIDIFEDEIVTTIDQIISKIKI